MLGVGKTRFFDLLKEYRRDPETFSMSCKSATRDGSLKGVFCLWETRVVDGYRRISLFNQKIEAPNVPLREYVQLYLIPDTTKEIMGICI